MKQHKKNFVHLEIYDKRSTLKATKLMMETQSSTCLSSSSKSNLCNKHCYMHNKPHWTLLSFKCCCHQVYQNHLQLHHVLCCRQHHQPVNFFYQYQYCHQIKIRILTLTTLRLSAWDLTLNWLCQGLSKTTRLNSIKRCYLERIKRTLKMFSLEKTVALNVIWLMRILTFQIQVNDA